MSRKFVAQPRTRDHEHNTPRPASDTATTDVEGSETDKAGQ
ncbi:MAG: hypothetical protein AVDCRST_MAG28-3139 [uncultured Rubrobacteraceae bacterium]|uniref:Uncharacterized protein n=1 Tax=uncultured Rubrobacteraceae bacterium TaxID=349277 RepID=A0A6J4R0Q5_9ACTN|nr:MAG: hypothetical protein AVDCRST_MAG28-3139 [uncultured Rubrobacteraceae bacterium]